MMTAAFFAGKKCKSFESADLEILEQDSAKPMKP